MLQMMVIVYLNHAIEGLKASRNGHCNRLSEYVYKVVLRITDALHLLPETIKGLWVLQPLVIKNGLHGIAFL